jgi:hypothetical protein
MADNMEKLGKVYFIFRKFKINHLLHGRVLNLKLLARLAIINHFIQEYIFTIILLYTYLDWIVIYSILLSIYRIYVGSNMLIGIGKGDFMTCYRYYKRFNLLMNFQIFNTAIILVSAYYDSELANSKRNDIFSSYDWFVLVVGFNILILYVLYSYTIELGVGRIEGSGSSQRLVEEADRFNNASEIALTQPEDIDYLKNAQCAVVNGLTLPSGLKVPDGDGLIWRVMGNKIRVSYRISNLMQR